MTSFLFSSFLFCNLLICKAQEISFVTVYFDFDKHNLSLSAIARLDSILLVHDLTEIHIESHCDSFGTNSYNDKLATQRANEVQRYLASKLNQKIEITTKSFGKRNPANQNETAIVRAKNRRAEITVFQNSKQDLKKDTIIETKPVREEIIHQSKIDNLNFLDPDSTDVDIEKIKVGSTLILANLNFEGGRHVLLPGSEKTLSLLLETLKKNPTLEIQIQGHICCLVGGIDGVDMDTQTMNLSVNRAKAIYEYLIRNGIERSRLSYIGFGSRHKLVDEITELDRSTNRRVEIKIVKK